MIMTFTYPQELQINNIISLKEKHRPENKNFYGLPNEREIVKARQRTRPWDNCWFSNKPHIINLTVEQAIKFYPSYMKWIYQNLSINWSTHTLKLLNQLL
jgi:hypothetical protein